MPPRRTNKENLSMNLQQNTLKPQQVMDNLNAFTNNQFMNMMEDRRQWYQRSKDLLTHSLGLQEQQRAAHAAQMDKHVSAYPYDAEGILESAMAMKGETGGPRQANMSSMQQARDILQLVSSLTHKGKQRRVHGTFKTSRTRKTSGARTRR